jgi:TPR repeat protein
MLGVLSGALGVVVAMRPDMNTLGVGAGVKGMLDRLMDHRQAGEQAARSFPEIDPGEDLKHGVISRLEKLPPTAAGMGNDLTSVAMDKDNSVHATSVKLTAKPDNPPVATRVPPSETTSNTGPAVSAALFTDDAMTHLPKPDGSADTMTQNKPGIIATGHAPVSPGNAMEELQMAAAQGDAGAQFNLGEKYATGDGVPTDSARAVAWYQKSAAQGNSSAQFKLGVMYRFGEGVPENAAMAAGLFEKAAWQGNVKAQYNLGVMYNTGDGVPMDSARAMEWLQKAAAQGDARAQNKLGLLYASGNGVPTNPVKAMEWFQKSATQGYSNAQFNIGMMYANGEGVSKNITKAAAWFRKAAAQGDADAQLILGSMSNTNEGIPKD